MKPLYMPIFMIVDASVVRFVSSIGKEEEEEPESEEHDNSVKIEITCITPVLQAFLDLFPDIISFQHVLHFGVGRSQIE